MDDGIERLLRFVKENPKSFAGGKLFNEDKSPQASSGPMYALPVVFAMLFCKGDTLGITRYSPDHIKKVDWVSGACLLGKKEAFVDVGLFDEGIFMYMEDIEFLYRARKRGYAVFFCPTARFIHSGAASSGQRRTPVVNIYQGLLYFYRKHRSAIAYTIVRYMLMAKALAVIAIGRMIGRKDVYTLYEKALRLV
jgi:GT2 family glycosyltransferase